MQASQASDVELFQRENVATVPVSGDMRYCTIKLARQNFLHELDPPIDLWILIPLSGNPLNKVSRCITPALLCPPGPTEEVAMVYEGGVHLPAPLIKQSLPSVCMVCPGIKN